jgi:hypothetical protein
MLDNAILAQPHCKVDFVQAKLIDHNGSAPPFQVVGKRQLPAVTDGSRCKAEIEKLKVA